MKYKQEELTKDEARQLVSLHNDFSVYGIEGIDGTTDEERFQNLEACYNEMCEIIKIHFRPQEKQLKWKIMEIKYFISGWFQGSLVYAIALGD
jgi:hypothetical protein